MKTELHVHTRYSHDSLLGLHMLAFACGLKKINCIAICDHNTISGAVKAKKIFSKYGIGVIVGEEIFTDSGEIIGLFLKRNVPAGLSADETISEIKVQNGLVYIPHPHDEKRYQTVLKLEILKQIACQVDLIEIHNGRNISSNYSEKQKEIAETCIGKDNAMFVCGSDAHTFIEIGRNYLLSNNYDPDNVEDFKEKIKEAEIISMPCLRSCHRITKFVRLIKLVLEGNVDELYRIIQRRCT